jgi:hypothetical protein
VAGGLTRFEHPGALPIVRNWWVGGIPTLGRYVSGVYKRETDRHGDASPTPRLG